MALGTNWFHSIGIFDSYIRYLCHKTGFAWASLILSSLILMSLSSWLTQYPVPNIHMAYPKPNIHVNTFNLVTFR